MGNPCTAMNLKTGCPIPRQKSHRAMTDLPTIIATLGALFILGVAAGIGLGRERDTKG